MHDAVLRAQYAAARERTCVIVAEQQQRYWKRQLWTMGASNVIVEPRKRGTANGILLATLHIVKRDPLARIVVLPADHYVRDEECLGASLREAVAMLTQDHRGVVLLGIEPEGVDSDLDHIVPGALAGLSPTEAASSIERWPEWPGNRW